MEDNKVNSDGSRNKKFRFKFFTLLELLIVVSIVAVLISILLPVLQKAKASAGISVCLSNQKQHGFAVISYAQDFDGWVPSHKESGINQYPTLPGHIIKYAGASWKISSGNTVESGILKCITDSVKYSSSQQLAKFSNTAGYFQNWTPGDTKNIRTSYSESNSKQALGGFFGWDDKHIRKLYKIAKPSKVYMFSEGKRSILYGPGEYNFASHGKGVTMVYADGHAVLKNMAVAIAEYWIQP